MDSINVVIGYFFKGGFAMYPLFLSSLIMFAIGIERFIYYKKEDSGEEFKDEFCKYIEADDWTNAKKLADSTKGETAKLATIVMARHDRFERLEVFVASRAERALNKFEHYLGYLDVIVRLAPILGLLGTITGMMSSFTALNMRSENPMAVTAGIGEALITTVFGLCIAIVAICFYSYFEQRLKRISLELEEISNTLLEAIAKNLD